MPLPLLHLKRPVTAAAAVAAQHTSFHTVQHPVSCIFSGAPCYVFLITAAAFLVVAVIPIKGGVNC